MPDRSRWNPKDPHVPFARNWHRENDGPPVTGHGGRDWRGREVAPTTWQPTKIVYDAGHTHMETYPDHSTEFVSFRGLTGVSLTLTGMTRGRSAATSWWADEAGFLYPVSFMALEVLLSSFTIRKGTTEPIDWKPAKKGANYYLDPVTPDA